MVFSRFTFFVKAKILFGFLLIGKNRYYCRSFVKAKRWNVNFWKSWSCLNWGEEEDRAEGKSMLGVSGRCPLTRGVWEGVPEARSWGESLWQHAGVQAAARGQRSWCKLGSDGVDGSRATAEPARVGSQRPQKGLTLTLSERKREQRSLSQKAIWSWFSFESTVDSWINLGLNSMDPLICGFFPPDKFSPVL